MDPESVRFFNLTTTNATTTNADETYHNYVCSLEHESPKVSYFLGIFRVH